MGKPNDTEQARARGFGRASWRGRTGAARRRRAFAALALVAALPARAGAEAPPGAPPLVPPRDEADTRPIRRALLIEHLKGPASAAPVERYLPAVLGTVFLATSVGLAAADSSEEMSVRQRWVTVGLGAGLAGLSFSAYLAPDRARRPLISSVTAMVVAGDGAALYGIDDATPATRFTFGSMILTGAIVEGLVLVDAAMRPAPSARRLERHLKRLQSSASVSEDDLRAAEAELALTERPIPLWLPPLVLMGGAIAAAAPALSQRTSPDDRKVCLLLSSGLLVAASSALVPALIHERRYRAYRDALHGLSLAPVGPQSSLGVTAAGSF